MASQLKFGIDLGGTKIEGVVLNASNDVLFRERIPTEQGKGYSHILGQIEKIYAAMKHAAGNSGHTLGIGTPGALSLKTGLLKNSNTLCLNDRPLHEDLEKKLGHPVMIENDANCFAAAEANMGAGRGKRVVFGIIMGTGCGGGLVIDGKPWQGLQHIAGEWGHHTIDKNGPPCYCGKNGCVEKFISGSGVTQRYADRYGTQKTMKEIEDDMHAGEERASFIFEEFLENFGIAVGNLLSILDPDIVVLGGGLAKIDLLYSEGRKRVEKYIFSDCLETPIVKNQCGDSAGVFGAAFIGV